MGLTLFLLCFVGQSFGQRILTGKVVNEEHEGVVVYNTTTGKTTITDQNGMFQLVVHVGDTLQLEALQYQQMPLIVNDEMFDSENLTINLNEQVVALDEVVLRAYDFSGNLASDLPNNDSLPNTRTLKLPNADAPVLTHNQRMLEEADSGVFVKLDFGLKINVHKILNRLSGRTKHLKKLVRVEEDNVKLLELQEAILFEKPELLPEEAYRLAIFRLDSLQNQD